MSRRSILTALTVLFVIFTFFSFLAWGWAGDVKDTQKDQQKMMEEYMKMMAPGENHSSLNYYVGNWDVKTTSSMGPGSEPSVSQSLCEGTMIMGGRFLMLRFAGLLNDQPFEGLQIVGYDNFKKKYVTFWIHNQGTGFYLTEGTRDSTSGVLTETGNWPDPMTGGTVGIRAVTKPVSKDEYVHELFVTPAGGKEFKVLENRMTRRQLPE